MFRSVHCLARRAHSSDIDDGTPRWRWCNPVTAPRGPSVLVRTDTTKSKREDMAQRAYPLHLSVCMWCHSCLKRTWKSRSHHTYRSPELSWPADHAAIQASGYICLDTLCKSRELVIGAHHSRSNIVAATEIADFLRRQKCHFVWRYSLHLEMPCLYLCDGVSAFTNPAASFRSLSMSCIWSW